MTSNIFQIVTKYCNFIETNRQFIRRLKILKYMRFIIKKLPLATIYS